MGKKNRNRMKNEAQQPQPTTSNKSATPPRRRYERHPDVPECAAGPFFGTDPDLPPDVPVYIMPTDKVEDSRRRNLMENSHKLDVETRVQLAEEASMNAMRAVGYHVPPANERRSQSSCIRRMIEGKAQRQRDLMDYYKNEYGIELFLNEDGVFEDVNNGGPTMADLRNGKLKGKSEIEKEKKAREQSAKSEMEKEDSNGNDGGPEGETVGNDTSAQPETKCVYLSNSKTKYVFSSQQPKTKPVDSSQPRTKPEDSSQSNPKLKSADSIGAKTEPDHPFTELSLNKLRIEEENNSSDSNGKYDKKSGLNPVRGGEPSIARNKLDDID